MWASEIIAAMVTMELLQVGLQTLSKVAMKRGMSNYVFIVYSNALALLFLLPSTFIFHRIRPCPRLTFCIARRIALFGFLSYSVQICAYVGIGYSSPTLSSAMMELTPAFTFILAIIARMEKLELKVRSSQAKLIGTIVSITGAFSFTFYKGPPITFFSSGSTLQQHEPLLSLQSNWIFGGLLLATCSFLLAILLIVQNWIVRDYPAELMVQLIACPFVIMQATIVALFAERDSNAWKLRPGVELVTIFCSAIFLVILRNVVQMWASGKKGPLFVTMFKPLELVIAVAMGVTFLGDTLHIGSVIGAVIIAFGFYSVMWGKAEEEKTIDYNGTYAFNSSSDNRVPLLQNRSTDI